MLYTGPYGNPMVNVFDPEMYSVYIIVAGGIGCTPMQAWFSELLEQHRSKKRNIIKVFYIWILKFQDAYMIKSMESSGVLNVPVSAEEENIFDIGIYLTRKPSDLSLTTYAYNPGLGLADNEIELQSSALDSHVHYNRPIFKDIFQQATDISRSHKCSQVCVGATGPRSLTDELIGQCKSSYAIANSVNFDFHSETFDF